MTSALEGLRVLDISRGMAGPLATMILADYGAEVIRIEPRSRDPLWDHPAYLLWNRGKKSIEIDLASEEGNRRALRMVTASDVMIESLTPGSAERLGMGWLTTSALNPGLVYCSISAFGQKGPYSRLRPYDGIVNAKSGRMRDQVGHQGNRPTYRAVHDTSYHTAMFSLQAILAGLRVAWVTGKGQYIDTSLLHGTTAPYDAWLRFEGTDLESGELEVPVAIRREADPHTVLPSLLAAQCKDGRWILHCHPQLDLFRGWIKAIGLDWIWDDPRYRDAPTSFPRDRDRVDLNTLLQARMLEKTAADWIRLYREYPDCSGEVVQTTQEALFHNQSFHNHYRIEIEDPRVGRVAQLGALVAMSETPAVLDSPAPLPGEHSEEAFDTPLRSRQGVGRSSKALKHPLDGITVVEIATWLATPFGTALLAELGARVIKLEPLTGDPQRLPGTNEDNRIRANQGKESVALNLKTAEGRRVVERLLSTADVLIHNFRLGVPERLGIDYEAVRRIQPEIVYLYASAYGSTGPDCRRAAFNPTVSAFSGSVVLQSGEGNDPISDPSADPVAGSAVATAVLLGLVARLRTGKGQYLETSMINSAMYCNSDDALDFVGKVKRRNPDSQQLGLDATYRLYETREGWVFLAAPGDEEFRTFCSAAGLDALAADDRFSTCARRYEARNELGDLLAGVFKAHSADEWETKLLGRDVSCVRADGLGHKRFLHEDRHTRAIEFMVPARHTIFANRASDSIYWRHSPFANFSETPCKVALAYEDLGEHTDAILHELGYPPEDVRRLEDEGVIYRGLRTETGV